MNDSLIVRILAGVLLVVIINLFVVALYNREARVEAELEGCIETSMRVRDSRGHVVPLYKCD